MKQSQFGAHSRRPKSKTFRLASFKIDDEDETELTKEDLKSIYAELQAISDKLREENRILCEREVKVKERERMLSVSQDSLQTVTDYQVKVKTAAVEERFRSELIQLEQAFKDKNKENKRLKENFETIKQANDVLKKELEVLQIQNAKLTKTSNGLQARLVNLQRKQEYEQKLKDSEVFKQHIESSSEQAQKDTVLSSKQLDKQEEKSQKPSKSSKQNTIQLYSTALSTLLDWVCEAFLRQAITDMPTRPSESYTTPSFIQERVLKVLPSLVEILRDNVGNIRCCLPCLQFIYWSLLHIDQIQTQQNVSMSTTLRRLGEEIYYPKSSRVSEAEKIMGSPAALNEKLKDAQFMRNSNSHVRFLSSLIVLKTLTRADVLANAFDVLKTELKSDQQKELFLYYQATNVIVFYMKPLNKTFISVAVDIILQMSAESPFQQAFLDSCSNENFFRVAALLLRSPLQDVRVMERLSIILQKLSKIKSNKRFFEIYTIAAIIQEMLVAGGNDNAFLTLNLKSVLFNLNSAVKF
uniref:Coiled-coil domain-containing protein 138 n=1 Tax=Arion vulgaris TaxID=1028688 RepID=A0A0B7AVS1_9EUPU